MALSELRNIEKKLSMAKLTLLGAGPGDPELITVKGVKALQNADVVLYDALANKELLAYCKPECEMVNVGKRAGIHQFQQIFINDMIVEFAAKHESVVRLKGGDPFVFGRGHEEMVHAQEHHIEVEVISGVSSSLAVPAANGIPLTKRGVNESFWVVTGTTSDLKVSSDVMLAAQSSATVVILMGMKHLDKIVSTFSMFRGTDEHVAVIQNGTCIDQNMVVGTLENIEDLVLKNGISSPAVITIGEVVKYHEPQALGTMVKNIGGIEL